MIFSFEFVPTEGMSWPRVTISLNKTQTYSFEISSTQLLHCDFDILDHNHLDIFYHKTENETVLEHGQIVKDQNVKLNRIWADDVLMEPWFITEGCYFPQYFSGIIEKFPEWPRQLPSQLIWHFPGVYNIKFDGPFWPWYSSQRKRFSQTQQHTDKDSERWENWSGSDNAHEDLVKEIYRLLNV